MYKLKMTLTFDAMASDLRTTEFPLKLATVRRAQKVIILICVDVSMQEDRLCGLVVRVLGYRSGGPGSIPGTTRKKQ
jgi:hypothetical protein